MRADLPIDPAAGWLTSGSEADHEAPDVEVSELVEVEVAESLAAQLQARAAARGMAPPDLLRRLVQGLDRELAK